MAGLAHGNCRNISANMPRQNVDTRVRFAGQRIREDPALPVNYADRRNWID